MNWSSLMLAHTLKARLRKGTVTSLASPFFLVEGKLKIGSALARVEIFVNKDFEIVLKIPPTVRCLEPWMRCHEDWHNSSLMGMCWVLEDEWRDTMAAEKSDDNLFEFAAGWLLASAASLANRHHYAYLANLTVWKKEWEAWGHGAKGVAEYERSRRKK